MIGLLGFKFGGDGQKLVRIALPHVVAMMHLRMGYSSTQGGGDEIAFDTEVATLPTFIHRMTRCVVNRPPFCKASLHGGGS